MVLPSCRCLRAWLIALGHLPMWMSLACYVVVASGVPWPVPGRHAIGDAYPCQHGRCGCTTAGHCWTSCCCHSPRERLAWAKRHGIVPLLDLMALANQFPSKLTAFTGADCCAPSADSTDDGRCQVPTKRTSRTVIAIEALRCLGAPTLWVPSGAVTAPVVFEHPVVDSPADWLSMVDQKAVSPVFLVDVPPPRNRA